MKLVFTVLSAAFVLASGATLASASTLAGGWVCKTAPIWNGRTSAERLIHGKTKEEAYNSAVEACRYSGYANYCVSQISCWEE